MMILRLIMVITFVLVVTASAQAEKRVALVIGNSSYQHASTLPNPENDARDIAASLERLGFQVSQLKNLSFSDMRRALGEFSDRAFGANMAVIFYAGHGMEVNKQNYLIPTDAKLATDRSISYEAVPLELVTEAVSGAKGLKLVMLDACRNNPFAASMKVTNASRSIGRGLARVEPVPGTLVSFAAKEGTVALDGEEGNSPYTKALLSYIEEPGLEINFLFRKVRDKVMEQTTNQQQPFTYGSLPGKEIYFLEPNVDTSKRKNIDNNSSNIRTKKLEKEIEKLRKQLGAVLQQQDAESGEALPEAAASDAGEVNSADAALELVDIGHDAYQNQDYEAALVNWKKAARQGNARAKYNIGLIYLNGLGVPKDYAEALKFTRAAADQGLAQAQNNLAVMYERGLGLRKDYTEAVKWYRKAAEQDYELAQYALGLAYAKGAGVDKDYGEALARLGLAADQGLAAAQYDLGVMHSKGLGTPKDLDKAVELIRDAADQGYAAAQHDLGIAYVKGLGVKRNFREAAKWYQKAAAQDFADAKHDLGILYAHGAGGLQKNLNKAAALVLEAVKLGSKHAISQAQDSSYNYPRSLRMEMQRILKNRGIYVGAIDGVFGPATKAAIRKYRNNS